MRYLVSALFLSQFVACSSGPFEGAPKAPESNDPDYQIDGAKSYYLIGNQLTPTSSGVFSISPPGGVSEVALWLGETLVDSQKVQGGEVELGFDPSLLKPGNYRVILQADSKDVGFAVYDITVSHPLYVLVSNDWDNANVLDVLLDRQEQLHANHENLVITHFVGPYTFTDQSVSEPRRQHLVQWLKGLRDGQGDEVGLHIHPYCNFVETTNVPCRHEPSTVYDAGDPSGYTVMCAAYTTPEFTTLLQKADELFVQYGLDKPTSFRAGGWTADESTLVALDNTGYLVDSSALNWRRMEEWKNQQNGVLYEWNSETWSEINETSQPYYPSVGDIQSPSGETIGILEVPDNGILVDYVDDQEMIEMFEANWSGDALASPTQYSIGYHPGSFGLLFQEYLDATLTHIDKYQAADGNGPVVYARVSDMRLVWPQPE